MERTLSSVATTGAVGAQNAQAEEAVMAQPELGSVDTVPWGSAERGTPGTYTRPGHSA